MCVSADRRKTRLETAPRSSSPAIILAFAHTETNSATAFVPQGIGADLIATLNGFSRQDVDAFALESQKRAAAAAITEAVVSTLGGNAATVDVIFHDIERHDWATGGVLWSDKAPAPPAPAAP